MKDFWLVTKEAVALLVFIAASWAFLEIGTAVGLS